MTLERAETQGPGGTAVRRALTLAGGLMLVGFVANAIQRMMLHPSGAEDDHEAIFSEYADSGVWVFTHLLEYVLVLVAFAGLLVLCHLLRRETPYLAMFAAGGLLIASAAWTALQGIDGIALKEAVDAWAAAVGTPQEGTHLADAETLRWTEWGLQGYFRVVLGLAFVLLGAAIVYSRVIKSWLGGLLAVAGLLSVAIGVSVGYAGLESDLQDPLAIGFQLIVIVFVLGLLLTRRGTSGDRAAAT
jgi:small-conductance mechanosensitive channel